MAVVQTASISRALPNVAYVMELARLVCSLFSPVQLITYNVPGAVRRGTKRALTESSPSGQRRRPRASANSLRHDISRLQNEDHDYQPETQPTGTTARQLCRLIFRSLSTPELEVILNDGRVEYEYRNSDV